MKMLYFVRLKNFREDRDLTQVEISEILNIDQRVYSNYETGKRKIPVNHLITLAKFYNTSIDYLVNLTDDPKPYLRK